MLHAYYFGVFVFLYFKQEAFVLVFQTFQCLFLPFSIIAQHRTNRKPLEELGLLDAKNNN